MVVPGRHVLALRRRQQGRLAARRVARERAAMQRVDERARQVQAGPQVVPTQGDLICFKVAVRPC